MKLLSELLFEGREDFVAQQMGDKLVMVASRDRMGRQLKDPMAIVQELKKGDPTPNGQFLQWIARLYINRQFKIEDLGKVREDLEIFMRNKPRIEKKDINQYKTAKELQDVVDPLRSAEPQLSGKQQAKVAKLEGAEYVFNTPHIKIIHLKNSEAAKRYSLNTRWCTSEDSTFEHYARDGKIFVIMVNDPQGVIAYKGDQGSVRKFQLHYESGQMMNSQDRHTSEQEVAFLSQFPEWGKFLNMLINQHYTWLGDE